ncbi:MAG: hypothetical protein VKO44_02905 [Cyanobacteriota bacterium]|nr:hypothetical protein [Cyanobacteriota bacterium]
MSITIKRMGTTFQVLEGADSLPEGTPVQLYTGDELQRLGAEHSAMLTAQMPSFLRGDEDEDAGELFFL